jgi:hypothetical protein
MYNPQSCWYKVEDQLYLGVREQKRLNTTAIEHSPDVAVTKTSLFKTLPLVEQASVA